MFGFLKRKRRRRDPKFRPQHSQVTDHFGRPWPGHAVQGGPLIPVTDGTNWKISK